MSTRKDFIKYTGLLSLELLTGKYHQAGRYSDMPDTRPNILFAIADDWSWPDASIFQGSDEVIKTPNFDRIAQNGALFTRAFTACPSCSPSRASILTGQYPHRLGEAANLWSGFSNTFPVYTEILSRHGYKVGFEQKGWKPGSYRAGGWKHNPAGIRYENFEVFFDELPDDKLFCYWFGSGDPHRPYEKDSGVESGMNPSKVKVPEFLPDDIVVRKDILDYYYEVERFDWDVGKILDILGSAGKLENTIVVITSDNGRPFPRAKANLYDVGTHMPLAIAWGNKISKGQTINDFVSLIDLAPTFLEVAGIKPPDQMQGRSLMSGLIKQKPENAREMVFLERERHAYVRKNNVGYPSRALRTGEFLYIRNLRPERWPAGDPQKIFSVGPFGDVDGSPTKDFIIKKQKNMEVHPEEGKIAKYEYFELAFDKRPAEELYDLSKDPNQLQNVAGQPKYENVLKAYRNRLTEWMKNSGDPRATGDAKFDEYPYYGGSSGKGNGFGNVVGPPTPVKN